ncbi:MAG TPA: YihY/virulence factor BrkB family protein [Conexibacter sp.]|jgi:membrane protein
MSSHRSGGLVGRLRGRTPEPPPVPAPPATPPAIPPTEPEPDPPEPEPEPSPDPVPIPDDPREPVPEPAAAGPSAPASPTEIEPRGWVATLKRAGKGFKEDGLQDWAAALTYFGVLSLFPLLLVMIALIGVFGEYPRTVNSLLTIVRDVAPGSAANTLESSITGVVKNKGGAGALLGIGLITALWSASGYLGAFMRATNAVYGVRETRPFWRLRPLQLAVTAVMIVAIALLAIAIVLSGSIARSLGDTIGLGSTAVDVWDYAKWPVMLLIAVSLIALLSYVGPNVEQPRFRWITPGAAIGVGILILASIAFAFYAGNFGSYNATYGALGGVIVFLVWLWIANLAVLFGVEVDAELARERALEGRAEARAASSSGV